MEETNQFNSVEERLASDLGWDLKLFHGAPFQVPGLDLRMRAEYELVNASAFFQPGQSRLGHLRLTKWLKFGNSIEQLHHLFHVAKSYGVTRIVLPPSAVFRAGSVGGCEIIFADGANAELGVGLAGLFYYLEPLGLERPTDELLSNVQRNIRPMLSPALQEPDPRVGPDDLVLHFRSGDVFHHPVAHYGQPPLSYYLSAIEREKPSRVWLVFEDRANPCIAGVENWLRQHRLESVIQSGSMEEDLRTLFSARRLVIGQTSFASSVAMLSTQLRRLYTFRSESWDYLRLPEVEMIAGVDQTGDYVKAALSQNWKASAEQLALMLSYPAEALRFEEKTVCGK